MVSVIVLLIEKLFGLFQATKITRGMALPNDFTGLINLS